MRLRDIPVLLILLMLGAGACSDTPTGPSTQLSIAAISPAIGSTTGGTSVSISGRGFASGATVTIGGAAATNITVQGSEAITAITPAFSPAGAVDIVVAPAGKRDTRARV